MRRNNIANQLQLSTHAVPDTYARADCAQIYKSLWLGSHKALDVSVLRRLNIKYVVNTSKELKRMHDVVAWGDLKKAGIVVMHLPWEDSLSQQIFPGKDINQAIQWIDQIVASGQQILVNCAAGRSRSTSLVCSYLIVREGFTFDQALALCQSKRPQSCPNPNFEDQLRNLEQSKMLADMGGTRKSSKTGNRGGARAGRIPNGAGAGVPSPRPYYGAGFGGGGIGGGYGGYGSMPRAHTTPNMQTYTSGGPNMGWNQSPVGANYRFPQSYQDNRGYGYRF